MLNPPVSESGFYQADPTPHRGVCAADLDTWSGAQGGSGSPIRVTEPPTLHAPHGTQPTCRAHPTHQPAGSMFLVRRHTRVPRDCVYHTPGHTPGPPYPHT